MTTKSRKPSKLPTGGFDVTVDGVVRLRDGSEEEAWRVFLANKWSDADMIRGSVVVASARNAGHRRELS
jgi:hypothetical protein